MDYSKGRKLYTPIEVYEITYKAFLTVRRFGRWRKEKFISTQFVERIMLAVTEVNDCPLCSYGHTKMSLEAGMTSTEIENMLSGQHSDVPTRELPAVMFAQHYAEYRGRPTKEAYNQIVKLYGREKAQAILGAIRMIMLGNAYGIPWGSFINRFKGKPDPRSSILYELAIVISTFFFIPVALVHALLVNLYRKNNYPQIT